MERIERVVVRGVAKLEVRESGEVGCLIRLCFREFGDENAKFRFGRFGGVSIAVDNALYDCCEEGIIRHRHRPSMRQLLSLSGQVEDTPRT